MMSNKLKAPMAALHLLTAGLLLLPGMAESACTSRNFNLSGTVSVPGEMNQNDAVITLEREWQAPWEIVGTATSDPNTGSYSLTTTADDCTGLTSATDWRLCVRKSDFIGGKLLKQKACVDRNWTILIMTIFERSNFLNLTWQGGRWAYHDPDDARYEPGDPPNPFILDQSGNADIESASALKTRIVNFNYPNGNFAKGLSFQRDEDVWSGGERFSTDGPSLDGQVFRINYPDRAWFTLVSGEPAHASIVGKTVTLSLDVRVLEGPDTQVRLRANTAESPSFDIGPAWRRISHTFAGLNGSILDFAIKTGSNDPAGFYAIDNVVLELGDKSTTPEIMISYYDGLNREIQKVVPHGNEDIVTAYQFDGMGRTQKIAKTFQAEVPMDQAKFRYGYQTDALDVANQYYSPGGPGPDAEGYAFTESEYTIDETDRILKGGSPGLPFSLDPYSGHPVQANYNGVKSRSFSRLVEMPYGSNEEDAAYLREISWDENGSKAILIRDKMGNVVTAASMIGEEIHATATQYDVMNNKKTVTSPRGVQKRFKYNTLGLLEERSDPDAGTQRMLHDQFGNARFTQTAAENAEDYFIGKKYDRLNRLVGTGRIDGNVNFIQENADLPDYPVEFQETFVEYFYDALPAEGSPAALMAAGVLEDFDLEAEDFRHLKGRVACIVTYNQFQNAIDENTIDGMVLKLFSYDEDGSVEASFLSVRGVPSQRAIYRYTETKKLREVEITTVAGSSQTYSAEYDDAGRLKKVVDATAGNAPVAEYAYWPHGAVRKITYGGNKIESDFAFNTRDWWLGVVHKNISTGEELFKEQLYYDQLTGVGAFPSNNYNGNISERVYAYAPSILGTGRFRISQHEFDEKNRMSRYDWGAADALATLDLAETDFDEKYSFSKDDELAGLLRGTNAAQMQEKINQLVTVNFQGVKDDSFLYRLVFGNFGSVRAILSLVDASGAILTDTDQPNFIQIEDENDRFHFRKTFRMEIDGTDLPQIAKLRMRFIVVLDKVLGTSTVSTQDVEVPFNASVAYERRLYIDARINSDAGYAIEPQEKIPNPSLLPGEGEPDYNHFSNYSYYPGTHRLEKISGTLKNDDGSYISRDIPGNYVYDPDGRLVEIKSHKVKIEYNWMNRPAKVSLGEGIGRKRTYNLYDEKGDRIAKLQYTGNMDSPITVGIPQNERNFTDIPEAFQKAKDDLQEKTNTTVPIYAYSPTMEFEPAGPVDLFTEGEGNVIEIIGVLDPTDIVPDKGMKDQTNDPDLITSTYYSRDASGVVRNEIRGGTATSLKRDILSVYGIDDMGRKVNGLTEVYLKNHQQSTMVVASLSDGSPMRAFDYHPYGMEKQLFVSQSEKVSPTFTGKELDDFGIFAQGDQEFTNNMLHFGARYFDPEIAMWSGPDAAEQFPSPYAYTSNPLSGYDPDGNSVVSKGVTLGVKAAAKHKMKEIIRKNIMSKVSKITDEKVRKEVLQEASDIMDAFEEPWWMTAITMVPVAGDAVDVANTFVTINKIFKRADELKDKVDGLTKVAKGSRNSKVADAAKRGREAHEEFKQKVKSKTGWESEPSLLGKDGKIHKPDALTPDGKFVELKPNTPSGRRAGKAQAKRYKEQLEKDGRVIYYDP